jgi:hypothetical protein
MSIANVSRLCFLNKWIDMANVKDERHGWLAQSVRKHDL